ncbi:MAG: helix-turn-helix domain-containing protein [Oscillospiraceae bacterium]|nr:helix-turn-helix domain-containing protein [Oscillospiraceae bacterium]
MSKEIGEIIAKNRVKLGMSQKELASALSQGGVQVSNQAVSKWENGTTQPNATQFLALCGVLNIYDVISEFTDRQTYLSKLNDEGRRRVYEYADILGESGLFSAAVHIEKVSNIRQLPLYRISVSAGTGQFLDSDDYELIEVGEDVPMSANFGVRVAGDSMSPRFEDGQIVWVRQQQTLNSGEIGIFLYHGDAFCKRLAVSSKGIELISLNKKYPPIKIGENEELKIFGLVVG